MGAKLLNVVRNNQALEQAAHNVRPAYGWTLAMARALVDEKGVSVRCPQCGMMAREQIGEGGPGRLRRLGWRFENGTWTHRCNEQEEPAWIPEGLPADLLLDGGRTSTVNNTKGSEP